jgi:hypothetical protein
LPQNQEKDTVLHGITFPAKQYLFSCFFLLFLFIETLFLLTMLRLILLLVHLQALLSLSYLIAFDLALVPFFLHSGKITLCRKGSAQD